MASRVDVDRIKRLVELHALARAEQIGDAFVRTAQAFAPRRTGAGADSIEVATVEATSSGVRIRVVVGEQYMKWQNEGTGVFGPRGQPIKPHRRGGVLVFDGIGGVVFAREVKGTEPTHFWERTVDAWPRIVSGV